jgi:hypothetical protein
MIEFAKSFGIDSKEGKSGNDERGFGKAGRTGFNWRNRP